MKEATKLLKFKQWFHKLMLSVSADVQVGILKPTAARYDLDTTYGAISVHLTVHDDGGVTVGGKFRSPGVMPLPDSINNVPVTGTEGLLSSGCNWFKHLPPGTTLSDAKKLIAPMFAPEGLGVTPSSEALAKALARKQSFIELVGDKQQAMDFADTCLSLHGKLPPYARMVAAGKPPTAKYWAWVAQEYSFHMLGNEK